MTASRKSSSPTSDGGSDGEFSYCESVFATGISKWHIRILTSVGKKLGGGIDTPSLCKRVTSGWDLLAEVDTQTRNNFVCPSCFAEMKLRLVNPLPKWTRKKIKGDTVWQRGEYRTQIIGEDSGGRAILWQVYKNDKPLLVLTKKGRKDELTFSRVSDAKLCIDRRLYGGGLPEAT